MKQSEAQAAILDYLALSGYLVIRLNNQPIYDLVRKIFRGLQDAYEECLDMAVYLKQAIIESDS